MIDLECPSCGRLGIAPEDKINSRLVCKKCHVVFHITSTGRTVKGEPPIPVVEKSHGHGKGDPHGHPHAAASFHDQDWVESFFENRRFPALLGILLIAVIGLGTIAGMARARKDSLTKRTEELAVAITTGNLATVKNIAKGDGADAATGWYTNVRHQLGEMARDVNISELLSNVFVFEENHAKQMGQSQISFAVPAKTSRDEAIARESGAASLSADKQVKQIQIVWVLDQNRWKLDGIKTAGLLPAPAIPTAPKKKTAR